MPNYKSATYNKQTFTEHFVIILIIQSHPPVHTTPVTLHRTGDDIYPANQRYKMLHENPALVGMWFFIRQMINKEVMRKSSYPMAYETWYARKFEFQDRGSVHEHAVKALTYIWIKANNQDTAPEKLTEDDFEEVTCRTDKLSMYCESGKIREIMVRRIAHRINTYMKDDGVPESTKTKLQIVKHRFDEMKSWISCRCTSSYQEGMAHRCAKSELQGIKDSVTGNKHHQSDDDPQQTL